MRGANASRLRRPTKGSQRGAFFLPRKLNGATMPFNPAFDDDSNPDSWFVPPPTMGIGATIPSTGQTVPPVAPPINPLATPPRGSWQGWPDPWQHFWSMFPASAAITGGWRPPVFTNGGSAAGTGLTSNWSTTPTLSAASPSSAASADRAPPWPPSPSLLGLIPYPRYVP